MNIILSKMKNFYFLLFFVFFSCTETNNPIVPVKTFFNSYEKEGSDKAIDELFNLNVVTAFDEGSKDTLKSKLNENVLLLGKYNGYEILFQRPIGSSIYQYSCIAKYDVQPVRFNFIFYMINGRWELRNFNYDNGLFDELNESSKLYYIE